MIDTRIIVEFALQTRGRGRGHCLGSEEKVWYEDDDWNHCANDSSFSNMLVFD